MNVPLAALLAVGFAALSAASGYFLTRAVLASAAKSSDSGGEIVTAARTLRGGTWIGILERVAVTVAVMLGHPAGIAYVVAIKGLGRWNELKDHPETSERFVIGTLASMLWAAVVGLAGMATVTAIWPPA